MDEHNNEDLIDSKLEDVEQTKVKAKKNVNWEKMRKFAFNFAVIVSLFLIAASVTP